MYTTDNYIHFDAIGIQPVDENGFIRFDKNCTPGKTIPCGNACRTPVNCKSKGKARVSEKGKELRQAFADKVRASKGMKSKDEVFLSRIQADEGDYGGRKGVKSRKAAPSIEESRKARSAKAPTDAERKNESQLAKAKRDREKLKEDLKGGDMDRNQLRSARKYKQTIQKTRSKRRSDSFLDFLYV